MYKDITCIILCGGKSSRMKENKAFLKFGDKYVIEIISELAKSIFENVILSTNEPKDYRFLNLEMVEDVFKESGPLAGIHSGLINSQAERNFILACDFPLINIDLIKFIVEYRTNKLITVPKADGFVQRLCGVYNKKCLPEIEEILKNNDSNRKRKGILALLQSFNAQIIDIKSEYQNYNENLFLNMNYPEDYEKAVHIFLKSKHQN